MPLMRILITVVMCSVMLPSMAVALEEQEWILVTDRADVQVYRKDDSDARLKTFRGVAQMTVDDFNAIGVLLDDYDAVAGFLHMVSEIRDLRRHSQYKRDVYITTRLPWPVSDRDAPLNVLFYQEDNGYDLVMPFSLNSDGYPEQDNYVRMPQMEGFFRFHPLSPGKMEVTLEVVLDPGGALPAWLANVILRDIPYFSLRRLRKVVNLPRYQGIVTGYYDAPESWIKAGKVSMPREHAIDSVSQK